jgi:hypothetical protein
MSGRPSPRPPSARPDRFARLPSLALVALLALLAFFVSPLWQNLTSWGGTFDWGYFFFLTEVDRKTVVQFGQFPLWNPYYCGGAVHLANPQTFFLSPTFLFIWAFGTPVGIRLTLTAAILLAVDGMRRFLSVLGVGRVGAVVGGTGYALSGALAQHLGGGHVGWVGFCVLPYVLHSFHRALAGERRHILYGALFMAWIFGHFGGYTFPYSALALGIYGVLWSASRRQLRRGTVIIVVMVAFALALSAVRLLPILEFMRGHPRIRPDVDIVSPLEFFEIYGARHRARTFAGHSYVWPEYGNYLGVPGLMFLLAGSVVVLRGRRDLRPVLLAFIAFLIFQVGNVPAFPWWLLKHLPIFRYMRAPSRFTVVAGIFACALIGIGVDRLLAPLTRGAGIAWSGGPSPRRRLSSWSSVAALALAIGFLVDEAAFNREQWFQTLATPAPQDVVAGAFRQVRGDRHRMYAYPRTNQGTLDCFEEAPLDISPGLRGDLSAEEYPLDAQLGTVRRQSWTPNHIVVETNFVRPGVVVVNQNFHSGWRVDGGMATSAGGLLAARVEAGPRTVSFRFLPGSFLIGLAVSLVTLGHGIWLWRRWAGNKTAARR